MKKLLLLFVAISFCLSAFAQGTDKTASKSQYILIIRFKADFVPPSKAAIDSNIKHWQVFMGNLAKNGKIAAGYRPGNDGQTISGTNKLVKNGAYIANDELVSSFLIINADNMDDANAIAKQCPVLEFGGSVEIRPIINTAN
jgi:hypothetical protein